jgi:uncharacterized protein with HEPN domain
VWRDPKYLLDRLLAARDAQSVVADLTQQTFENSRTAQLAAEHALQIIGDAASRLSQETRDGHPEISWSEMIGLRNRLVRDYGHIDLRII